MASGSPADLLVLLSHALAALLFAAVALWTWRSRDMRAAVHWWLVGALVSTAIWALAVAGIGARDGITVVAELLRNLTWLAVIWTGSSGHADAATRRASMISHATVALVFAVGGTMAVLGVALHGQAVAGSAVKVGLILRLLAAVAGLVLVQNAHVRASDARTRVVALAVAAIWLIDVNILTLRWAASTLPPAMLALRGAVMVGIATILAVTLHRDRDTPVQLSRTVAVQSLSLLALLSCFAIFAGVTEGLAAVGGAHARMLQTAFVFGSTAAALAVLSTPTLRAWLRVKAAKHLFRHRFDYRAEWMRFTATLGERGDALPLGERIVRAIGYPVDSPGGALLVADGDGLTPDAAWRFDMSAARPYSENVALASYLAETGRIIELDAIRAGDADPADAEATPRWMLDHPDAWVVVPLPHRDGLAGAVLLTRAPIDRSLDWEDFDLLKVAGRQAASHLAEARAQARLAETERFDEFNRRFAFILHDIKNLVSQISLVARNAERHADNPAFRADMIATLNESAARMNELVARLSPTRAPRADTPRAVAPLAIAQVIAAERRLVHPVRVEGDADAVACADPAGIEQVLRHLVQNAVEASPADQPVTVSITTDDGCVTIDVSDQGHGMSAAFIRDRLFKPFVSTKPAGFGIGAYEARSLARAMGGSIEVESREGIGSRFRLILPRARPASLEHAA